MDTRLSVNINKVVLIRNARGSNLPDLAAFAVDCESYGADGQRFIQGLTSVTRYDDIPVLKQVVKTELNIEGNPPSSIYGPLYYNVPDQVTLVPRQKWP